jgi:hypothetical protein
MNEKIKWYFGEMLALIGLVCIFPLYVATLIAKWLDRK